ncbi:MAG TPA: SIMPL domain-containing protein [Methanothrix sp.]|nr:SIMPL domain-containing protein [Methanothrix sp.]HPT18624.1 SIMPL domain-containing protein [Methanothrix sp.]
MKIIGISSVLLGLSILLAAALVAAAQDSDGRNSDISKLIVQGEGKVTAAPDRAVVVLGVETEDASAAIAAEDNARLMNQTISALLSAGIAESNIQTSGYSLGTVQEDIFSSDGKADADTAPQFLASNTVTVILNNTSNVGRVLDAAVSAGSNTIHEVSFELQDSRPQKDEALALAIQDAGRKAAVASQAAGVKLGRVLEISESYGYVGGASSARGMMYDAATPIQPGRMEVTSSVTVTYEISGA